MSLIGSLMFSAVSRPSLVIFFIAFSRATDRLSNIAARITGKAERKGRERGVGGAQMASSGRQKSVV